MEQPQDLVSSLVEEEEEEMEEGASEEVVIVGESVIAPVSRTDILSDSLTPGRFERNFRNFEADFSVNGWCIALK